MRTFSIRSLMAVVVVAAIGMAAFVVGSPPWAGAMLSLSFFTLTCALLGVAFGRNERRIYWIGFASLGWAYMALIYAPVIDVRVSRYLFGPTLSQPLYEAIHPEAPAQAAGRGGFQSVPIGPLAAGAMAGGGGVMDPDPDDLGRIAIAIEALLWASLGGWAALYFASGEDGCLGVKRAAEIARPTPDVSPVNPAA